MKLNYKKYQCLLNLSVLGRPVSDTLHSTFIPQFIPALIQSVFRVQPIVLRVQLSILRVPLSVLRVQLSVLRVQLSVPLTWDTL
jgi:hypothetical protein